MKSFFVVLYAVSICVFLSCSNSGTSSFDDYENTFSFEKHEDNININSNTTLYIIKCKLDYSYKAFEQDLIVAPDYTTAIKGEHYKLPETMRIKFGKHKTATLEVELLPENITEELRLTFTSKYKDNKKDYTKYIDTLFVTLTPAM